jgi:hypothetical protein
MSRAWSGTRSDPRGLIAANYAVPRPGPVPGSRAQVSAQRIGQRRGHQRNRGDPARSAPLADLFRMISEEVDTLADWAVGPCGRR